MELPEISPENKNGNENFYLDNQNLEFTLKKFWIWNQSNLIENRTRGILAEFIVKEALNIKKGTRIEWDNYDLITASGIKIEIKSASYIQSWKQKDYSKISFDIEPKKMDSINPKFTGKYKRWSDFYVFCLLDCKNQTNINPLNLNQWTFYVLNTNTLDEKVPKQKRIRLNPLLKLQPIKCNFAELKNIIK